MCLDTTQMQNGSLCSDKYYYYEIYGVSAQWIAISESCVLDDIMYISQMEITNALLGHFGPQSTFLFSPGIYCSKRNKHYAKSTKKDVTWNSVTLSHFVLKF